MFLSSFFAQPPLIAHANPPEHELVILPPRVPQFFYEASEFIVRLKNRNRIARVSKNIHAT